MSSSKSPIFRMFNPSGRSKEESVEKRREQVRRAQHVYRQRKTRYVKALEGDLAAARRRETDMSVDKSNLERQVKVLLHLLEQHSITVPDGVGVPHDDYTTFQHQHQQHHPNNYAVASQLSHPEWPQAPSCVSPIPSLSTASDNDPILASPVCELDWTMVGMRFVLKIEEPCLGHVHGDPSRPDDPSNHALTVTSQLLCISSKPPPKRASLLPVQDVPGDILGRLLELAPAVTSGESELTPIQAWDSLRRKPVLGSLNLRTVMTLAERLRDAVKCHGFGAVMEVGVFEHLVGELIKTAISSRLSPGGF